MAAAIQNRETEPILFQRTQSLDDLKGEVRERYGDEAAQILERIDVKAASTKEQDQAIQDLSQTGLNGEAKELVDAYSAHGAEIAKRDLVQKTWLERWGENIGSAAKKTGEAIFNVTAAPLKAIVNGMRRHKLLTAAVLATILGVVAYNYGIDIQKWVGAGGDETAGAHIKDISDFINPDQPLRTAPEASPVGPPAQQQSYPNATRRPPNQLIR